MRNFLFERHDIHERHQNDRAGNLRRIKLANQLFHSDDGHILRAMRTGHKREHGPGLRAIHHHHRNIRRSVYARRNFDVAIRFLAGGRSRRANRK